MLRSSLAFLFALVSLATPVSAQRCVPIVDVSPDEIEAGLASARAHLSAGRHRQAAGIARAIAIDHASTPHASPATELFASASTGLLETPDRSCAAELSPVLATLHERHCERADAPSPSCERVTRGYCHAERLRIEGLQAERDHREASLAYTRLARLRPSCGRVDELLFNAALNADAAGLPDRGLQLREILLQNFPSTSLRARALWLVAQERHRLAERARSERPDMLSGSPEEAQAAEAYERFAREHERERGTSCTAAQRESGTCPDAEIALFRATTLRVRGVDADAAQADAELYRRRHGTEHADRADRLDEIIALRFPAER